MSQPGMMLCFADRKRHTCDHPPYHSILGDDMVSRGLRLQGTCNVHGMGLSVRVVVVMARSTSLH